MSTREWLLPSDIYAYVRQLGLVPQSTILTELADYTATLPQAQMQSSPEGVALLVWLVQLMGAKQIIEVGTFTGYATLALAEVLPEQGRIITIDIEKQTTEIARQFWQRAGLLDKIESHIAPANQVLQDLQVDQAGQFDFVFIDANKKAYREYYEASLALLRPQGGDGVG